MGRPQAKRRYRARRKLNASISKIEKWQGYPFNHADRQITELKLRGRYTAERHNRVMKGFVYPRRKLYSTDGMTWALAVCAASKPKNDWTNVPINGLIPRYNK